VMEVLPGLRILFLEGMVPSGPLHLADPFWPFVNERQRTGHPVYVRCWDRTRDRT
jgi:hypothetical protein